MAATPTTSPRPSGVQHASLTVDNIKRTYRLYVPLSLDPKQPAPLVVLLHWAEGSADAMATVTRYDDQAEAGKFIVVYLDTFGTMWKAGTGDPEVDVTFISRLLDRLTSEFRIDKARIFVAGVSSGGMMAYRLACQLSDRIAAIASVAGALLMDFCTPARPISILEMHGTDDSTVAYAGNDYFSSTALTMQRWVFLDGCAEKPAETTAGITTTSLWTSCRGGTVVRLDTIAGGQHTWFNSDPARVGQGGPGSQSVAGEPDATHVTWDFFSHLPPRA